LPDRAGASRPPAGPSRIRRKTILCVATEHAAKAHAEEAAKRND
jgi:hypothetical protein